MNTKVKGETRERLGQSAKRSAAVRGQAGKGSYSGRPGAVEQNVEIFCLPGFVADRGQICFSCGIFRASSFMCATHLSCVMPR